MVEVAEITREKRVGDLLTLVGLTHDLAVARYMCDRIAVMYLGETVELAATEEFASSWGRTTQYGLGNTFGVGEKTPTTEDFSHMALNQPYVGVAQPEQLFLAEYVDR